MQRKPCLTFQIRTKTRFTLVSIFPDSQMFPDLSILGDSNSLAFTLKGYSNSWPFTHGHPPLIFIMKWLTSCLLPRQRETKEKKKKARDRLRQFEVSFHSLMKLLFPTMLSKQAFVLSLSRIAQVFDHAIVYVQWKVWRKSTLFASIILVSKKYSITYCKRFSRTCNRMKKPATAIKRASMWPRPWLFTRSAILVLLQTQKFACGKNMRIRERIVYTTKHSRFKSFQIQNLQRHDICTL